MNTQECDKQPAPQERRSEPEQPSPEDWVAFLRKRCAGCHQEPC